MDSRKDPVSQGPVTYLVRVGSRVRYCHVDHLLKSKVMPEDAQSVPNKISETVTTQTYSYQWTMTQRLMQKPLIMLLCQQCHNTILEPDKHPKD